MEGRAALLDDPQLRPFLPLLYVAWADGDLVDADRTAIAGYLAQQPWLRPAARTALEGWLDASKPPSACELAEVKQALERAVGTLAPDARRSLSAIAGALSDDDAATARAAGEVAAMLALDAVEPAAQGVAPPSAEVLPEVQLDIAAMTKVLDGEHTAVRVQVRKLLDDPEKRAYGLAPDA